MFVLLSLTDLFLCTSETKETITTNRVSIFSEDKEIFLKHGKHDLTHSSKAAPGTRKSVQIPALAKRRSIFNITSQRRQRFCIESAQF